METFPPLNTSPLCWYVILIVIVSIILLLNISPLCWYVILIVIEDLTITNHHGQIRLLLGDPADVARVDLLTDHVDKLTAEEREVVVIMIITMI